MSIRPKITDDMTLSQLVSFIPGGVAAKELSDLRAELKQAELALKSAADTKTKKGAKK